jgi:hypothetical protein
LVFEDLVDDAIVTAPGRVEPFEFAEQWLPEPLWIISDRPEHGCQRSVADLFGELVEVT